MRRTGGPDLDKLIADAHHGKLERDGVLAGGSTASLGAPGDRLDDFRARGIDFLSLRDGIGMTTHAGRFSFTIIAAVAELERELIRERTRAGLHAARRRGSKLGRPRVVFDLGRAVALRGEGRSIREVAGVIGVHPTTLHRALGGVAQTSSAAG